MKEHRRIRWIACYLLQSDVNFTIRRWILADPGECLTKIVEGIDRCAIESNIFQSGLSDREEMEIRWSELILPDFERRFRGENVYFRRQEKIAHDIGITPTEASSKL